MLRRVLYDSLELPPEPPVAAGVATPRGGDGFFDGTSRTRIFEVALLSALFFDPSGNVPSPATPHGWEPQPSATERIAKPFPAKLQQFAPWQPQGDLVSTPQGWPVQWPDRFALKFPPKLQDFGGYPAVGNVPTQFVGNAWVAAWDGPARKRFPAAAQRFEVFAPAGDLTSTPQGWPATFPERFAKPVPASLQRFDHFPPYQAATAFVGNAWLVNWDGPPRKPFPPASQLFSAFPQYQVATAPTAQGWGTVAPDSFFRKGKLAHRFDVAFLAAATSVVTYPDGWTVWSPERLAKRFPASVQLFSAFQPQGTIASTTPQGFGAVWADIRRVRVTPAAGRFTDDPLTVAGTPRGFSVAFPDSLARKRVVALAPASVDPATVIVAATPQGWQAEFPTPIRRKPALTDALTMGTAAVSATWGHQPAFDAPPRRLRLLDARIDLFAPAGNIASPTTPQGWVSIFPERFAVPVRASLQLFQFMHWWRTVAPASIIAQPTLLGSKFAPSLTGTDAAPTLSGKMALTINLTGKVGA